MIERQPIVSIIYRNGEAFRKYNIIWSIIILVYNSLRTVGEQTVLATV